MMSKREEERRERLLKGMGWTIYVVSCPDGSFYTGMTKNMKRDMYEIFTPRMMSLSVVYQEDHVPFRDAYAKHRFLKACDRDAMLYILQKSLGWTIYIAVCSNGALYADITRDLDKEMAEISEKPYFLKRPELLPIKKIVYREDKLPFREAYTKFCYLRGANRRVRLKILKNKKVGDTWPFYTHGTRKMRKEPDFSQKRR
jgi:hypothetical protein